MGDNANVSYFIDFVLFFHIVQNISALNETGHSNAQPARRLFLP